MKKPQLNNYQQSMENQNIPLPSKRLQAVLNLFETNLKEGQLKGKSVPEWYVMSSALIHAFEVFDKSGTDVMFDTSNPFDLVMLTWCLESVVREKRKTEVPTPTDLTLN